MPRCALGVRSLLVIRRGGGLPQFQFKLAIHADQLEIRTVKKYKAMLHKSHGIVQKEYVTVPAALLRNTNELKKYLDLRYEYVKTYWELRQIFPPVPVTSL